jgi:putative membrane protein
MEALRTSLDLQFKFWILQTVAFMLTCFMIPRLTVRGPFSAFLAVVVLAFVNAHYWNAAFFYAIPNTFAVGTLMLVFINGAIFFLVVKILPGIELRGLLPAILAPIVLSVMSMLVTFYGQDVDFGQLEAYIKNLMTHVKSTVGSKTGAPQ